MLRPALVLFALLTLACSGSGGPEGMGEEEDEAPMVDPRTLVETGVAETGSVGDYLVSNGTVESEGQADLVPETTGTVIAIKAEEGDVVRKGQVLAVIDNASLDAALARAEAELAKAQAELSKIQTLHGQGVVSDRDLQDAEFAEAAALTALAEARSTQGHTRLVSPINGTVAVRQIEYGEVAGGQLAFQVVDLSRLRVVIRLPERDLQRLAVGQSAVLTSVYDDEATVPAHVERIAPTVDPLSGTVRVTVTLDEPEAGVLRPGQFVSVRIEVGRHDDVLTVPRNAVFYEEGLPMVFRVRVEEPPEPEEEEEGEQTEEEDEEPGLLASLFGGDEEEEVADEEDEEDIVPGPYRVARKVSVELGFSDPDFAELTTGLELGDEVVTVGHANLRDEGRVRFTGDPAMPDPKDDEDEADEESDEGEDKL
jgi:membrane fusion protein, multidrug efflux system